jgi:subtilase family serine protease
VKRFLLLVAMIGATALPLTAMPAFADITPAATYQHACAATAPPGYATCLSLHDTALVGALTPSATPSATDAPGQYEPADLQRAYSLTAAAASRGSGETVAIVDAYKDPDILIDLTAYRSYFGLGGNSLGNLSLYNEDGGTDLSAIPVDGSSGWDIEESLDVEMVAATCPRCSIDLIEANSNSVADLATAANTAAGLPGVAAVSNSYGAAEFAGETGYDADYDHPGVAVTASTGDSGYGVEYPSASPYVTAVGGTSLTPDSSVARGWSERVWGDGKVGTDGDGAGSGCSAYETKASWQGTVSDPLCADRTVADVAADADPDTGVWIYDSYSLGGWQSNWGGTSMASPIIAAAYALAGPPAAGSYPASFPYAHPAFLHNVPAGSNGGCGTYLCNGGPGYNGPTGLGTPDGLRSFMATDDTVTVTSPGAQSGTQGKAITALKISASDTESYSLSYRASGLPPGLAISASGTISGTPSKGGTASVTVTATSDTGASASASFPWAVTADKLTITNPGKQTHTAGQNVSLRLHATSSTGSVARFTTATGLPPGLHLNPYGLISGKLTKAGTYVCTIRARDAAGTTASVKFTWVVRKA